jgi:hypothetical protein
VRVHLIVVVVVVVGVGVGKVWPRDSVQERRSERFREWQGRWW